MTEPFYTAPPAPGPLPDGKRVFVCTDHDSHYVGGASVVVAFSEPEARGLLDAEIRANGLNPNNPVYTLREIGQDAPVAVVLLNGDY